MRPRLKRRVDVLWVVEVRDGRKWVPTVCVGIDRIDGRDALADFRAENPDDKSHLAKYVRAGR